MRHSIWLAVFSTAVLLVSAGNSAGQAQAKSDEPATDEKKTEQPADKQDAPPLVGPWRAESVSVALPGGNRRTFLANDKPVSVIFSENSCTIRVGGEILVSTTYVLDPKQDPWTVDMKSKEGELLGICAKDGDNLKLSLNDPAEGRPRDFNSEKHAMVLRLRRFLGESLLVMNADGSDLHQVLTMPEFTFIGSPDWSHDGGKIAFDSWRSVIGEGVSDAHVFVVNADGSSPKDLGAGAMPSWSPDDKQLTYCQYDPERGVWIMNADGSDRRQIDAAGWGSQWSPNRNEIAYTIYGGDGAVLSIYDVAKKEHRELQHKPYRQILWGFTWSPDGTWICFKGVLPDGGREIAAVSVEGEKKGFKVLLPSSARPEISNAVCSMAWGASDQILVSMQTKTDRVRRLYVLDFTGVKPPQLFPDFPADWVSGDLACSPDGKKVALSAHHPPRQPGQ
jgi:uncharacterized protein (TIGR03067 family)